MGSDRKYQGAFNFVPDLAVEAFRGTEAPTAIRETFDEDEGGGFQHSDLLLILFSHSEIQRPRVWFESQLLRELFLVASLTYVVGSFAKSREYGALEHGFSLFPLKGPLQCQKHVIQMFDSGCGDLDRFTPTQPNAMNQPQLLKFNQVPRRSLLGRFQQLCKVRRGEYDLIRVRPDLDQLIECD